MDLHLPSLHLFFFFILLFFSHYCSLWLQETSIDQYVSPTGATRGNNAILGTVLLIQYYYIIFLYVCSKEKKLIE